MTRIGAGVREAAACGAAAVLLLLLLPLSARAADVLNVHVIGHSHCDPGWLTTFEGYYNERVRAILSRVIEELDKDAQRTFTWAEISFFSRWYDEQPEAVRGKVKALVRAGRFEFVAGGWVQNDEANANYDIVMDQVTEGHEYIWRHFGVRPRVAWQIDPFGHSSLTPSLFAQMGFDALVINRIHHHTKNVFKQAKHMEFVWRGSHSLKQKSDMLTHVLYKHYSAPEGFDWEEGAPTIDDSSAPHRAREFARQMHMRGETYRSSHILVTWGDDFKFLSAGHQFGNMDRLIKYINDHRDEFKMNVFYSTPERYFRELHEEAQTAALKFPLYVGDFFPYADNEDSYWTGYYTTRPKIKLESRRTDGILAAAESAYALARTVASSVEAKHDWSKDFAGLLQGRRDASLVQHHDGITGTAKSWVGADYLKRLADAAVHSFGVLSYSVPILIRKDPSSTASLSAEHHLVRLQAGISVPVVIFNGQGWRRSEFQWVRVSPPADLQVVVYDGTGTVVPSQFLPSLSGADENTAEWRLYFLVDVPALGASTYFVTTKKEKDPMAASPFTLKPAQFEPKPSEADLTISNEQYDVSLSTDTRMIGTVKNKASDVTVVVNQDLMRYRTHNSGAYIFRSGEAAQPFEQSSRKVTIVKGKYIQQFGISVGKRSLVVTLYSTIARDSARVIEQVWSINADGGEEVITRYNTDLNTKGIWFTDNGLEMIPRSLKQDKAAHKNYYPCPSTAYITENDAQFTVLTSSAMGVSSLQDGQLELMMHRRLQQDDGRGLGEAVNDDSTVETTSWLLIDTPESSTEARRHLSVLLNHPTVALQNSAGADRQTWLKTNYWAVSALAAPMPDYVHLMTFRVREGNSNSSIAIRLLHTQEAGERNALSVPVSIDAASIFAGLILEELRQSPLTFTDDLERISARRWQWTNSGKSDLSSIAFKDFEGEVGQNSNEKGVFISKAALEAAKGTSRSLLAVDGTTFQLAPREIKAFLAKLTSSGRYLVDAATLPALADAGQRGGHHQEPAASGHTQSDAPAIDLSEHQHRPPPIAGRKEEEEREGGVSDPQDLPRRQSTTAPRPKRSRKPSKSSKGASFVPTWLLVSLCTVVITYAIYRVARGRATASRVRALFRSTLPVDSNKFK